MSKELFKKYHSKLVAEGWIKAVICGLIFGLATSFIALCVGFLIHYNMILISILAGLGIAAISIPIMYYKVFVPTVKSVAERLDRLGLQERCITMMELEQDETYIARVQREDVRRVLKSVSRNVIKISIFRIPVAIVSVLAIAVTSALTLSLIKAQSGWFEVDVRYGIAIYDESIPYNQETGVYGHIEITDAQVAAELGYIEGDTRQVVAYGKDATAVKAVANEESYYFVQWSDGYPNAERTDLNVTKEIKVFAIFSLLGEGPGRNGEDEEGEGDPNLDGPSEEIDPDKETPKDGESDETENDETGDPEEENEDGEGEDESEETPPPDDEEEEKEVDTGLNSESIIDGQTPYRDEYAKYYEEAMQRIENGEEISDELREIFEKYIEIIK